MSGVLVDNDMAHTVMQNSETHISSMMLLGEMLVKLHVNAKGNTQTNATKTLDVLKDLPVSHGIRVLTCSSSCLVTCGTCEHLLLKRRYLPIWKNNHLLAPVPYLIKQGCHNPV